MNENLRNDEKDDDENVWKRGILKRKLKDTFAWRDNLIYVNIPIQIEFATMFSHLNWFKFSWLNYSLNTSANMLLTVLPGESLDKQTQLEYVQLI